MDKRMTVDEVVASIRDGDTIVTGGCGLARKPMALVRAIARSSLKDLTLVSFIGGPDVDLLVGVGKVKQVISSFVGLETAGLAPHFRAAREAGTIQMREWSEFMVLASLDAAAKRLPFLPVRSALGTDIPEYDPELRTVLSPYTGERFLAVPPVKCDVALIHVNAADTSGYGLIYGEPYADAICSRAARKTFLSAERLISRGEVQENFRLTKIMRFWVSGVVEAPGGAHLTSCFPDYEADLAHAQEYSAAARTSEDFQRYMERYVAGAPAPSQYLERVGGSARLDALKKGG